MFEALTTAGHVGTRGVLNKPKEVCQELSAIPYTVPGSRKRNLTINLSVSCLPIGRSTSSISLS